MANEEEVKKLEALAAKTKEDRKTEKHTKLADFLSKYAAQKRERRSGAGSTHSGPSAKQQQRPRFMEYTYTLQKHPGDVDPFGTEQADTRQHHLGTVFGP